MKRTHKEVAEEALRDPLVYIEYHDGALVDEFNKEREKIRKRTQGEESDSENQATH